MNQSMPIVGDAAIATASLPLDATKKAVKWIALVVPRQATVPVLTCALVEIEDGRVRISGTDLDTHLRVAVEAETIGSTKVVIGARLLAAFVAGAEGPVRIEVYKTPGRNAVVTLTDGQTSLRINAIMSPEDFPAVYSWNSTRERPQAVDASPSALLRLLRLASPCISTEETRYYLNGVFFQTRPEGDTLRAVSTDGHRMAVVDSDISGAVDGAILPREAVRILRTLLGKGDGNEPWRLVFYGRGLSVRSGLIEFDAKLIDGTFPDYSRVAVATSHAMTATLNAPLLTRFARMMGNDMAFGRSCLAVIDFDKGEIVAKSSDNEMQIAHHLTARRQESADPRAGFNLRYLASIAKVAPTFTLSSTGHGNAARIDGEDPDAFWIVMPMRM